MAVYSAFVKQYQEINAKPQTKSYFSLLATLVLLIILIALIYPALKHITVLNKELSDARATKTALLKKIQDLSTAQANLAAVEKDLGILNQALPIGSSVPAYVKELEDLSAKDGLGISSLAINSIPMVKPSDTAVLKLSRVPFSVGFSGSFLQFKQLLVDSENSKRSAYVDSITMKRETNGAITSTVIGNTFYLGEDKAENTAAQTGGPQ